MNNNNAFKTGYYLEETHLESGGFEYMEVDDIGGELDLKSSRWNPYSFLHGHCDLFAKVLNQKFGYPILYAYGDNGCLAHAYCIVDVNGKQCYVDVRGICSDWDEFISEFDDWLPIDEDGNLAPTISSENTLEYHDELADDRMDIEYIAEVIIDAQPDYYTVKCA